MNKNIFTALFLSGLCLKEVLSKNAYYPHFVACKTNPYQLEERNIDNGVNGSGNGVKGDGNGIDGDGNLVIGDGNYVRCN